MSLEICVPARLEARVARVKSFLSSLFRKFRPLGAGRSLINLPPFGRVISRQPR